MAGPTNYIVDMDIERFFDTIDHKWLMEFLGHRIGDPNLLRLIARILKSGVVEDGKYIHTDEGTPQGGNLSPLLANIYLHYVLDLWFEKRVKKELEGYAELIRYADQIGTIHTYTGDMLAASYNPPAIYGAIKFDIGGKFYFDLTDCDLDKLSTGMPVKMSFRRKYYDPKRDISGYFWKAVPIKKEGE